MCLRFKLGQFGYFVFALKAERRKRLLLSPLYNFTAASQARTNDPAKGVEQSDARRIVFRKP
jgi:hypothetical protein